MANPTTMKYSKAHVAKDRKVRWRSINKGCQQKVYTKEGDENFGLQIVGNISPQISTKSTGELETEAITGLEECVSNTSTDNGHRSSELQEPFEKFNNSKKLNHNIEDNATKCFEVSTHLESTGFRFLVSEYSFLPNDSDFGDVECALKRHTKMYSPEDYIQVMKSCRRKHPIEVVSMKKAVFVSTLKLEKEICNRKKSRQEKKINWLKIKEIKILKEKPYSIFNKNTYEDTDTDYKEIDIKKGKGKPQKTPFSRHLQPLWPNGKPVAEAKLKDIESYLYLIPLADHPFYVNIISDNTIKEDLQGYNGELDFEIEED
ncbi:unnamed protein product [Psylliodes chrysocephalus]|uniref:Uncharacterized protein n=1 Tax=Psylliodes chrysocephalus TaxID=3402493 RepID=A0A9P0GIM9_9CUCU|nr:unnamed protein product [Psylliodes chrysocephala]